MYTLLTIQYDPRSAQYLVMAPDGTVLTRCEMLHDADTAIAQFAFLATFPLQARIVS
jgi:hypothetical protein